MQVGFLQFPLGLARYARAFARSQSNRPTAVGAAELMPRSAARSADMESDAECTDEDLDVSSCSLNGPARHTARASAAVLRLLRDIHWRVLTASLVAAEGLLELV